MVVIMELGVVTLVNGLKNGNWVSIPYKWSYGPLLKTGFWAYLV